MSEFVSRDCPVIPVLLPNAPTKLELPVFLRQFTWVDFRVSDPDPMYQLRWGITGKKPQLTNSAPSLSPLVTPSPVLSISQSPSSFTETLSGNIKLEMVKILAGSFLMGSADNDEISSPSEKPQHPVKLQEFYLGKYPVTQEQYQAVMGKNPSAFKDNPKNPVENVSWDDAQKFCQTLSEKTGKKYRLPSEAEWEYACRAGSQTRYYFGDNEYQLGEYAWYNENSDSKTHPVGQKKSNDWGVYDMHGNVWEWCDDGWHHNYHNAPTDGSSWDENSSQTNFRSLRGGSLLADPWNCRSANRNRFNADDCSYVIGFRLAVSLF